MKTGTHIRPPPPPPLSLLENFSSENPEYQVADWKPLMGNGENEVAKYGKESNITGRNTLSSLYIAQCSRFGRRADHEIDTTT